MDKSKGSLIVKFSGKESLSLNVLSKLCACLTNVLNKISLVTANIKYDYSVSYNTSDGFSLTLTQDVSNNDSIIENNVNAFNTLIDILSIRRFIAKSGNFTVSLTEDECVVNNGLDSESFSLVSYNIYSSDSCIEDNLSKLSATIISNKNSFQAIYKNGILEKRVNYSKEDLEKTSLKIDLENIICTKEEYKTLMALQVEQLDLLSTNNWKFKDVANTKNGSFKAKIKDKDFTKNLKSGNVVIGYGLILKGDVKTTVVKDSHGKIIPNKSTYVIEKVHDVLYSSQVDKTTLNIEV